MLESVIRVIRVVRVTKHETRFIAYTILHFSESDLSTIGLIQTSPISNLLPDRDDTFESILSNQQPPMMASSTNNAGGIDIVEPKENINMEEPEENIQKEEKIAMEQKIEEKKENMEGVDMEEEEDLKAIEYSTLD